MLLSSKLSSSFIKFDLWQLLLIFELSNFGVNVGNISTMNCNVPISKSMNTSRTKLISSETLIYGHCAIAKKNRYVSPSSNISIYRVFWYYRIAGSILLPGPLLFNNAAMLRWGTKHLKYQTVYFTVYSILFGASAGNEISSFFLSSELSVYKSRTRLTFKPL